MTESWAEPSMDAAFPLSLRCELDRMPDLGDISDVKGPAARSTESSASSKSLRHDCSDCLLNLVCDTIGLQERTSLLPLLFEVFDIGEI